MCGWRRDDMISISLRMWTMSCSSLIFSFRIDLIATWTQRTRQEDDQATNTKKKTFFSILSNLWPFISSWLLQTNVAQHVMSGREPNMWAKSVCVAKSPFLINCVFFVDLCSQEACATGFDLLVRSCRDDSQMSQTWRRCHLGLSLCNLLYMVQNEGALFKKNNLTRGALMEACFVLCQGPGLHLTRVLVSVWAESLIWASKQSLKDRSVVRFTWWNLCSP